MINVSISRFLLLVVSAMAVALSGCDSLFDLLVSPAVSVGTHELAFTAVEGGDPPAALRTTAECTTSNSSTSSVIDKDDCTVDITSNQDWLSVAPISVTGHNEISVSVNTAGLKAGTYAGKIHVEYNLVAIDDEEDIDVTLTVTAPPVPAAAKDTPKSEWTPDVGTSAAVKDVMKTVHQTETESTEEPPPEPPADLSDPDRDDKVFEPEPFK